MTADQRPTAAEGDLIPAWAPAALRDPLAEGRASGDYGDVVSVIQELVDDVWTGCAEPERFTLRHFTVLRLADGVRGCLVVVTVSIALVEQRLSWEWVGLVRGHLAHTAELPTGERWEFEANRRDQLGAALIKCARHYLEEWRL